MLVKIENVGKSPINLPVKPRLEDVQPKGSSSRFEYYSLTLPLMAGVPSGAAQLGWLMLYGSTSIPVTLLTIKPGQWIRVRGDIVVSSWYSSETAVIASTDFWLSKNVFPGDGSNNGFVPEQDCIQNLAGASIPANMKPHPLKN